MNRYISLYDKQKLEDLDFIKPATKALLYGFLGIVLGVFGYLLAPLANLNDYSYGNLFLGVVIGLIIFGICFKSFLRLKRLHKAKIAMLGNIAEIENKLFVESGVNPWETLIGLSKENALLVLGRNKDSKYYVFIATHKYLHFSPVRMTENQALDFEHSLQGEKMFFQVKESL